MPACISTKIEINKKVSVAYLINYPNNFPRGSTRPLLPRIVSSLGQARRDLHQVLLIEPQYTYIIKLYIKLSRVPIPENFARTLPRSCQHRDFPSEKSELIHSASIIITARDSARLR